MGRIPIAREGFPFILSFLAGACLLIPIPMTVCRVLGAILLILALFSTYFFRDPAQAVPQDPGAILAPGDGRVLEVAEEWSPELGGRAKVIRIFLSIFDIHVQRSPISGIIGDIRYITGKFLDARDPRASFENEQNLIVIEQSGGRVVVRQIAGFIARRIACWVRSGQPVDAGERIGLIRFGSQVDLAVPEDSVICVSKGERVIGGASVVAWRKRAVPPA
ncbi:MAG: phosphatidylserine decarboxylase [Elusimicrobia bacterium RIFCSPLOWO2_01_FULL_64_13]|nr:MAG: phosphatidylserine decarboxylase [Elusimicrobia bacterium RIFCSPHIGHO2_01_FULL_64_10]OGR95409.1 MAG: phosphatidylserine decarboxylase [Elusimicrobia bacterium RIFCSPLOWO2_01_FULL_64_13]